MAQYKEDGKCKGLIVTGCLSQQYQDELFQEIPEIDALIGTGAWDQIMVAVDAILNMAITVVSWKMYEYL